MKHFVKLRDQRRYREESGSFVVFSKKLIEELSHFCPPKTVLKEASSAVFRKITQQSSPEGIAAEFPLPSPSSLLGLDYLLVLDAVADPGNLGMLLRSALALGWQGVLLLEGCVDPFNPKAISAARSALFHLPYRFGTIEEIDAPLLVADLQGERPTYQKRCALVLGNESQGPSIKGPKVSIPQRGEMESLNVAAAGSILMYTLAYE